MKINLFRFDKFYKILYNRPYIKGEQYTEFFTKKGLISQDLFKSNHHVIDYIKLNLQRK